MFGRHLTQGLCQFLALLTAGFLLYHLEWGPSKVIEAQSELSSFPNRKGGS